MSEPFSSGVNREQWGYMEAWERNQVPPWLICDSIHRSRSTLGRRNQPIRVNVWYQCWTPRSVTNTELSDMLPLSLFATLMISLETSVPLRLLMTLLVGAFVAVLWAKMLQLEMEFTVLSLRAAGVSWEFCRMGNVDQKGCCCYVRHSCSRSVPWLNAFCATTLHGKYLHSSISTSEYSAFNRIDENDQRAWIISAHLFWFTTYIPTLSV